MEEQEPKKTAATKILDIMADLDYIAKGDKTVNGQYRFVSHDQVTEKIHGLLVKHRLLIISTTDDMTQDGNRTVAKMRVSFVNADDSADFVSVQFYGYGVDSGDKGPGKAVSYAVKYAVLKTFNIQTGDDPDNNAKATYEPPKTEGFDELLPKMTKAERVKLDAFIAHSASVMGKHAEDVKREASGRIDSFLAAFSKWKPA